MTKEQTAGDLRKFPRPIRRIVVKLGSSVIASYRLKPRAARLRALVDQVSSLVRDGREVILVSSGAIVLGMGESGLQARPSDLASLQALAAIGQNVLMMTYSRLFKRQGLTCGQILLTWDDFNNRDRFNNARNTLSAILERGCVPIINENDTISTDEIRFGDNDKLAALVASQVRADLLVILSDVEGLYDTTSETKKVFQEVREITGVIEGMAGGTEKKHIAKGGMTTKLEAIKIATQTRIPCVITSGHAPDILPRILRGDPVGTYFYERAESLLARRHWIFFVARPKGRVVIDDGARDVLLKGGKSLLLPGVVSWEGHFAAEDVVMIFDREGHEIGRGITNYSVSDLHRVQDKRGQRELIHCDQLVLSR